MSPPQIYFKSLKTFKPKKQTMGSAHRLDEVNMWPSYMTNLQVVLKIWSRHEIQPQTIDLKVWPWPWPGMVETWVLHIVLMRWTSDPSFMKILQAVFEIWSGHEIKHQPLTFKRDLDLDSRWSRHGLCTLPWWGEHVTQVSWKSFKVSWRYGADTK